MTSLRHGRRAPTTESWRQLSQGFGLKEVAAKHWVGLGMAGVMSKSFMNTES